MEKIDAMGKPCPQPVILAKKALDALGNGVVEIRVDNETSVANLQKFAENMGARSQMRMEGAAYLVTIENTRDQKTPAEEEIQCEPMSFGADVQGIAVGSRRLGHGSDELGEILMKSFLYTVAQTEPLPKALLFFNGGVHLTTEGSPVLDDLKEMADKGVAIISCGTCLDFFHKKEQLQVGEISNMYTIYETMRELNALVVD